MAYTQVPTWTTAQIVTAAHLNTYLSDNLDFLIKLAKENIAVINDTSTNNVSATSYSQVGSVALNLTTIDSYSAAGVVQDTAVLLVAWINGNSATATNLRWYNSTAGAVPSILGPSGIQVTNNNIVLISVDRPATGANTYHLQGFVASGTGVINRVVGFALEIMR